MEDNLAAMVSDEGSHGKEETSHEEEHEAHVEEHHEEEKVEEESAPPQASAAASGDGEDNEETLREEDDHALGGFKLHRGMVMKTSDRFHGTGESLGGKRGMPSFCLLDGAREDPTTQILKAFDLGITRLPAILGRTHKTQDPHAFGMGNAKALSRQQCRIDYWCNETGRLMQTSNATLSTEGDSVVHPPDFRYEPDDNKTEILNPTEMDLETQPFYSITCLGKNRIVVNGHRVEQGQTCVLPDGAALRISSFLLYFILPKNFPNGRTMEIPVPPTSKAQTPKKRKLSAVAAAPTIKASTSANDEPAPKRGRGFSQIQAELDALDTDELRRQLTDAIENDVWDRRHQLIGSTLSGRAVLAAAEAPELREKAGEGLSRGEIIDWITNSSDFSQWAEQMHTKLEHKSFQSSITKAMLKAGFTRTASTGRYIKWMLPSKMDDGSEKPHASDADDDDAGGSD